MLLGEQAAPIVKRLIAGAPVMAFLKTDCAAHVLGPQALDGVRDDDPRGQA